MLSFKLTPQLQKEILSLNGQVAEKYAQFQNLTQSERDALHRFAKISTIGASTRIENALLTDQEVEWVDTMLTQTGQDYLDQAEGIKSKLSKDRERSIEEVAGCRALMEWVYAQGTDWVPLRESTVRGLHGELLKYYPKAQHYLGRYKIQSNSVVEYNQLTGKTRSVFKSADAGPVTKIAMEELLAWYNNSRADEPFTVALATEFVFRFLAIHPFQDGNGHLGRTLFLVVLMQSDDGALAKLAPNLAFDREIEKRRAEYYKVLNQCSNGVYHADPCDYQIEYFLSFMLKVLRASLDNLDVCLERHRDIEKFPAAATEVLKCFKEHPEILLQIGQIINETNLPRRTVGNALNRLRKLEMIQRKGQGPTTRYRLVY